MTRSNRQWPVAIAVGGLIAAGIAYAAVTQGPRMALLGVLLGATLFLAAFGFSSAYRAFLVERDGRGIQAQLLMLAVASVLFAPLLARGEAFGQVLGGALAPRAALDAGPLADETSLMDLAVILGATLVAGLGGRFLPPFRADARPLLAALVGGLLMGYGARLAYGCNVGAFFSGVASFSPHGWLWIAAALPGNWLGVRIRPWFGLSGFGDRRHPPTTETVMVP